MPVLTDQDRPGIGDRRQVHQSAVPSNVGELYWRRTSILSLHTGIGVFDGSRKL